MAINTLEKLQVFENYLETTFARSCIFDSYLSKTPQMYNNYINSDNQEYYLKTLGNNDAHYVPNYINLRSYANYMFVTQEDAFIDRINNRVRGYYGFYQAAEPDIETSKSMWKDCGTSSLSLSKVCASRLLLLTLASYALNKKSFMYYNCDVQLETIKEILETDKYNNSFLAFGSSLDASKLNKEVDSLSEYVTITRYSNKDYDDLIELYGEKIIFKFGDFIYINDRNILMLFSSIHLYDGIDTYLNNKNIYLGICNILGKSKEIGKWFIRNYYKVFKNLNENSVSTEIVKPFINDIIDSYNNGFDETKDYKLLEDNTELVKLYKEIFEEEELKNNGIQAANELLKYQYCDNSEKVDFVRDRLNSYIKAAEDETKNNLANYKRYSEAALALLLDVHEEEDVIHPEVEKMANYIIKQVKLGIIKPVIYYEDLSQDSLIKFNTNPLIMNYIDLNSLRKAYASFGASKEIVESICNNENKYAYVTMPVQINISFTKQGLYHGYHYHQRDDLNMVNYHMNFGSNNKSRNGTCYLGRTGCLGNYVDAFSNSRASGNITKYFATIVQYIKSFDPLDYAGGQTLYNASVINLNTGVIVENLRHRDMQGIKLSELFTSCPDDINEMSFMKDIDSLNRYPTDEQEYFAKYDEDGNLKEEENNEN